MTKTSGIFSSIFSDLKVFWKSLMIIIVPLILSPIIIVFHSEEAKCGYVISLMAVYWIFELLPLPVTGFFPVILFPCLGIMGAKKVASLYFQDTTMIFLGGLMIALAIERVDLHKRIGTGILLLVGSTPPRILIGFLIPTGFLSMWINNTATTSMMLPATEAVIKQYSNGLKAVSREKQKISNGSISSNDKKDTDDNFCVIKLNNVAIVDNLYDEIIEKNVKTGKLKTSSFNASVNDDETIKPCCEEPQIKCENFSSKMTSHCNHQIISINLEDEKDFKTGCGGSGATKQNSYCNEAYDGAGDRTKEIILTVENFSKKDLLSELDLDATETVAYDSSHDEKIKNFAKMLSIAVAYGSLVGGTATLTGSTTNLLVAEELGKTYDEHNLKSPLSYAAWLSFGLPHAIICLFILWIWLQIYFFGWRSLAFCKNSENAEENIKQEQAMKIILKTEYEKLGPMKLGEILVVILMVLLVLLWIFRDPEFLPGYAPFFKTGYVTDSFPPMLIAILLFILPMEKPNFIFWRNPENKATSVPALLDWETVSTKLPWGPIFLIGSGFVLAEGCKESGLSDMIANQLNGLSSLAPWLISTVVSIIVSCISEVMANVTVMALFLPILIAMADNYGINPLYLVFPCGISASYAYMLPVAAPSNAVVFAYGHLTVLDMVKVGFGLKIISLFLLTIMTNTLAISLFNLHQLPWITNTTVSTFTEESIVFLANTTTIFSM